MKNKLPYPRDYRSLAFQRLGDEIHAVIAETEMPDVSLPVAPANAPIWEPLPDAGASEVIGLLEVLDSHGGRADVFADTPKQDVVLTSEGHEVDVDVVLSTLALSLPYEDPDRMLHTLANWGRHADLFDHDPARGKLLMESAAVTTAAP